MPLQQGRGQQITSKQLGTLAAALQGAALPCPALGCWFGLRPGEQPLYTHNVRVHGSTAHLSFRSEMLNSPHSSQNFCSPSCRAPVTARQAGKALLGIQAGQMAADVKLLPALNSMYSNTASSALSMSSSAAGAAHCQWVVAQQAAHCQ